MSGVNLAVTGGWLAAAFRADAVRRLIAMNTIAGASVEDGRASPVPTELLPFIGVYADQQDSALQAIAGTEPRFDTKLHLVIEPRVSASPLAAAVAQLDMLVGQITDGLMTDPTWVRQFDRIGSITIASGYDNKGEAYTGLARITFVLEYTEEYHPILGQPFTVVDLTEHVGDQQFGATIVIPAD